jgi:hypothetical protein
VSAPSNHVSSGFAVPAAVPPISLVPQWIPAGNYAAQDTDLRLVLQLGGDPITNLVTLLDDVPITAQLTQSRGTLTIRFPRATLLSRTDHRLEVSFTTSLADRHSFAHAFRVPLFFENFDHWPLGHHVDELVPGEQVWTRTMQNGWGVDVSGVPGAGNPLDDGVTEWAGWSIVDRDWWALTSGDQQRSWFTNAHGPLAVADSDEWDDLPRAPGFYRTFLSTPAIPLDDVQTRPLFLKFDSSWRPEDTNTANVKVAYDNTEPIELLRWESDPNRPHFKAEAVNETIVVPLHPPAGARSMVLTFGLFDADNDWWWAIDNVVVDARPPAQE